jgi:hypothetical protein
MCCELAKALPHASHNVRGLVDKDYSELLETIPHNPFLFITEFSCMECYALNDSALEKFSNVYLGIAISKDRF